MFFRERQCFNGVDLDESWTNPMVLSWLSEQLGLGTNEVPADGTDHGGHGSGTADETAAKRVRTEGLVEPQVPVHPNLDESLTSAVRRVARLQVPVDHHGLRLRYTRTQTAPPLATGTLY